jgi:2-haloacid dehalogenase
MTQPPLVAVVFDAYGTLFDLASAVRSEEAQLGDAGRRLGELWRRKQLEYTWLRSLMGSHADFWQVTADSLDYALQASGFDDEEALRQRLLAAYRRLDTYPEAPACLDALRAAGLRTAILSNGEPSMLQDAVASAGLAGRLDHVLSVEAVGVFKPDPRVYRLAVTTLGVEASRIGFVSSNGWDAHGAAHFGFRTWWVNRAGLPAERLPGRLAGELRDLSGLPQLARKSFA